MYVIVCRCYSYSPYLGHLIISAAWTVSEVI